MNHRFTTRTRRALVAVGSVLAALLFVGSVVAIDTAPSFAATTCTGTCQGGSVSASVSVASTITLTLDQNTLDFGSNNAAGTTANGNHPIGATVKTNDSSGYGLSVSATDFAPVTIAASNLGVTTSSTTNTGGLQSTNQQNIVEGGNLILAGRGSMAPANGDVYSTVWTLTIPGNTPGGSSSATITYLAAAN